MIAQQKNKKKLYRSDFNYAPLWNKFFYAGLIEKKIITSFAGILVSQKSDGKEICICYWILYQILFLRIVIKIISLSPSTLIPSWIRDIF